MAITTNSRIRRYRVRFTLSENPIRTVSLSGRGVNLSLGKGGDEYAAMPRISPGASGELTQSKTLVFGIMTILLGWSNQAARDLRVREGCLACGNRKEEVCRSC